MTMASLDKVAIVTGGHARVGEVISRHLSQQGWSVLVHAHRGVERARALDLELHPEPLGVWQADLEDTTQAVAGLEAQLARLSARTTSRTQWALVCNASRFENDGWDTMGPEAWRAHHAIHYETPVFLLQALARRAPQGQAVVVLDQNVLNLHGDFLSYCLSKTAMYAALPRLALAMAPFRVNAVAPGPTLPLPDADLVKFDAAAAGTPLGHGVDPLDVARAVAFLLDARSSTGQTVFVDAGQHLQPWREPAA